MEMRQILHHRAGDRKYILKDEKIFFRQSSWKKDVPGKETIGAKAKKWA